MFTGIVEEVGIVNEIRKGIKHCSIKIEANKIIGIADEALYKAKNSGKNKVIISEK